MTDKLTGVYCAAATPLGADLAPDLVLFASHCRRLLEDGCDGIALLGTTGEANSFSIAERHAILEAAIISGIAPNRLLPGTGAAAVPDAVQLTRNALALGVEHVVMLPPYYYNGVSDEGLFAAYAEIIERVGDKRLRVILYHIPQMSGVAISPALIARLRDAYPETVVGIKDSGGDLERMRGLIKTFPGFSVLAGADPLLLPLLRAGGAGCITATSNLVARELRTVFDAYDDVDCQEVVEAGQARIIAVRELSNQFGAQISTIKAMLSIRAGLPQWAQVRPPLTRLDHAQCAALAARMAMLF